MGLLDILGVTTDSFVLFYYLSAFATSILIAALLFSIITTDRIPSMYRSKNEYFFKDEDGKSVEFPIDEDKPSIDLSVIVPAYNEEVRLSPMLDECIEFLESKRKDSSFTYEIIIVSDGSKDKTVEVAQKYVKQLGSEKFRVLPLERNRGKGGAVRLGMQSARGCILLFVDADGATKFSDYAKVEKKLFELCKTDDFNKISEQLGISIGSRAHLQDEAIATRSFFRTVLMYGFHFLVWFFTVKSIKDTQCGFKLFTRKAAKVLFNSLHVERWAFDVELLYLAEKLNIPIGEVAVNWTEIDGSKVTPVWSWIQMGYDLFLIWIRYKTSLWEINGKKYL